MFNINFGIQFWVQMFVYAVSFGIMYGSFKTKLDYLEKKMDKHNQLQDRMAVVEQSVKSTHHRINELKDDVREELRNED